MELINLQHPEDRVSFREAVLQGLGRGQGLFFPDRFETLADVPDLLCEPFVPRSAAVLQHLIGDEIEPRRLAAMVASAFDFANLEWHRASALLRWISSGSSHRGSGFLCQDSAHRTPCVNQETEAGGDVLPETLAGDILGQPKGAAT